MSPSQLWQLSVGWHGDRLRPDWRRKKQDEAHSLFAAVGLSGPFWRLA